MPQTYLERYNAGDRIAVWDDLVALGEDVRDEPYFTDAVAVAAETMRRARHNVDLLIQRLDALDYKFLNFDDFDKVHWDGLTRLHQLTSQVENGMHVTDSRRLDRFAILRSDEMRSVVEAGASQANEAAVQFIAKTISQDVAPLSPPTAQTPHNLAQIEEMAGGPMPLSLRAWYEQVGGVSFQGWHGTLSPNPDQPAGLLGIGSDPLIIWPLEQLLEILAPEPEPETLWLAPDAVTKAGEGGGGPYAMEIPDASADAIFNDDNGRTFVNYLRNAFEWGGFPGWEKGRNPPRETIAKLAEGLLPL